MAYKYMAWICITISTFLCTSLGEELNLMVDPAAPSAGVKVTIRCQVPPPSPHTAWGGEAAGGRCKFQWNVTIPLDRGRLRKSHIYTRHGDMSVLFIPAMSAAYDGAYTCRAECEGRPTRAATIHLHLHDNILDEPGMYASVAAFAAVFLLLVGTTLCAISDRRKRHHRQRHARHCSEALLHQGAAGGDTSECNTPRAFSDPPPRYSTVIVMPPSAESPESPTVLNSSHCMRTLSVESQGSVFLVPSYDEALKYLERNGMKVDTKKLEPVPPRYSELDAITEGRHPEQS